MLIKYHERFIAESDSEKNILKIGEYLAKLQQERGCLMHSARLANTLLKDEESARDNHVRKASPYSITERRVPELIPVLGSQPAGDVSHKPGGRLPLLSARPSVTHATLKKAATSFAAW